MSLADAPEGDTDEQVVLAVPFYGRQCQNWDADGQGGACQCDRDCDWLVVYDGDDLDQPRNAFYCYLDADLWADDDVVHLAGAYGLDERDTDTMSTGQVRRELQHLSDVIFPFEPGHDVGDRNSQTVLADRHDELFRTLKARSDVDVPECPDCEGTTWSQSPGDSVVCRECGREVVDGELSDAVHQAWSRIQRGTE